MTDELLGQLEAYSVVFSPEDLRVLALAFDKAWETALAASERGAIEQASRDVLAGHIVAAAMQGERDERRLRQGALVALASANRRED
jgi:hypothetical protein